MVLGAPALVVAILGLAACAQQPVSPAAQAAPLVVASNAMVPLVGTTSGERVCEFTYGYAKFDTHAEVGGRGTLHINGSTVISTRRRSDDGAAQATVGANGSTVVTFSNGVSETFNIGDGGLLMGTLKDPFFYAPYEMKGGCTPGVAKTANN